MKYSVKNNTHTTQITHKPDKTKLTVFFLQKVQFESHYYYKKDLNFLHTQCFFY